mmetsp:Transcript_14457/g.15662  ORF Transcript_14457/g.15662 Transcript_14457/m.15662 type:complete len:212 (-) Transcript_14457:29-664(-)
MHLLLGLGDIHVLVKLFVVGVVSLLESFAIKAVYTNEFHGLVIIRVGIESPMIRIHTSLVEGSIVGLSVRINSLRSSFGVLVDSGTIQSGSSLVGPPILCQATGRFGSAEEANRLGLLLALGYSDSLILEQLGDTFGLGALYSHNELVRTTRHCLDINVTVFGNNHILPGGDRAILHTGKGEAVGLHCHGLATGSRVTVDILHIFVTEIPS